jgi:hypothetical protein
MSDEDDACTQFHEFVDALKLYIDNAGICPECAISALGAVVSELLWKTSPTNREARIEAKDFCLRVAKHVNVLADSSPDQSDMRLQ